MSKTYNQLTSKLSKKDVNGNTVTMKASGCGVCALASIAYNISEKYTLDAIWEYMTGKGYTIREGSTRVGMTEAIKHYGMKSEYYSPAYSGTKFDTLMSELKKCLSEDRWGLFLMYGTKKGAKSDYWTHNGHYITVTDYDAKKGYYVRDSANGRTGWHSKSEFSGCIVAGWIVTPASVKKATEAKSATAAKTETKKTTTVKATCAAKDGVIIRTSAGVDTGKRVPYGKTVTVKKKSAATMIIKGTKYTMAKITYGSTEGYVAQKYFKF
jgi:hypothetical protein